MANDNKVSAGQRLSISARVWNEIQETNAEYQQRRRLGEANPQQPRHLPPGFCKVKNVSGGDWERGSVVALGTPLLTETTRGNPWFEANDPAAGDMRFAVLVDPLLDESIGYAVAAGHFVAARVNVRNTDHRTCDIEAGSNVLQSHFRGPITLHATPTGTGEELLFVSFPPIFVIEYAKTYGGLTAKSGGTLGTGTIKLWDVGDSGGEEVQKDSAAADRTATCENGYTAAIGDELWLEVQRVALDRYKIITVNCGA